MRISAPLASQARRSAQLQQPVPEIKVHDSRPLPRDRINETER